MTPTPEELDATLEVLRRHRVAVFKSESFSVEFDAAAFEGAPESSAPSAEPGTAEEASEADKRANLDTLFRSAK